MSIGNKLLKSSQQMLLALYNEQQERIQNLEPHQAVRAIIEVIGVAEGIHAELPSGANADQLHDLIEAAWLGVAAVLADYTSHANVVNEILSNPRGVHREDVRSNVRLGFAAWIAGRRLDAGISEVAATDREDGPRVSNN